MVAYSVLLVTSQAHKEQGELPHALPVKEKIHPLHSGLLSHDTPLPVTPKFLRCRNTHTPTIYEMK